MNQNTPEWLELRKKKIGSSDAPIILEKSPWMTPFQLFCQKLSLVPERKRSVAMQRGLDMEAQARHAFENITGIIMFPQVIISSDFDFMMASMDGIDIEGKHAVEIKCPGKEDHQKAMDGVVPEKYIPQLQHQMIVAKLEMIFYFSYNTQGSKIIEVKRDPKFANMLIEKEKEFWDRLQNLEAPPFCERDFIERKDDLWLHATARYIELAQDIESKEVEREMLKEQIIAMAGNDCVKGGGVRLSKSIRKGNIDYKAIPELQNMDLEPYRKAPIESWRLSIQNIENI